MKNNIYKLEGNANYSNDYKTIYVDIKISSLAENSKTLPKKDIANIISLALLNVKKDEEENDSTLAADNFISFGKISLEYPIKKRLPAFLRKNSEILLEIQENDQIIAEVIAGAIKTLAKEDAKFVPHVLSTIMKLQKLNKNLLSFDLAQSRQSLSKWLHGKAKISDKNLIKLASLIVPEVKNVLKKMKHTTIK